MKTNIKCLFLIIFTCLSHFSFAQVNLSKGLIGFWNFDDSTAKDHSTNGNNGTLKGTVKPIRGIKGTGFYFNGTSSYVDVPSSTNLNLDTLSDWSISVWFKNETQQGQTSVQPFVAKMTGGSTNSDYYLFEANSKLYWGTGSSADASAWMNIASPTLYNWHHLVASIHKAHYSGKTYFIKKLIIDTTLMKVDSGTVKASAVTKDLFFGASFDGNGSNYLSGSLDEIRLYNRVLTNDEIRVLYTLKYTNDIGVINNSNIKYCEGKNYILVNIQNYGDDTIKNFRIDLNINGTYNSSYYWNGVLLPKATLNNLRIDSINFKYGTSYSVKVHTFNPNGHYDENGVNDTGSYVISVNPLPISSKLTNVSVCNGEPCSIGSKAKNGFSYSWSSNPLGFISNISNPTFIPNSSGTYILTKTNLSTNCSNWDTVNIVVNPRPNANWQFTLLSSKSYKFIPNDTTLLSYLWVFGDNTSSNEKEPIHSYLSSENLTISLEVKDKNSCTSQLDSSISVQTNIEENIKNTSFCTIFPNPAKDYINLRFASTFKLANIKIYNSLGQLVYINDFNTNSSNLQFKLPDLSKGIYNVFIYNGLGGFEVQSLLIQ